MIYFFFRLDMGPCWDTKGIADHVPAKTGPLYVCLVPQVDEDGNEIAGIRLPEIAAPLATFIGWSMRSPFFSRTLRRNAGRVWPLAVTAEQRKTNRDPRKSILERYPTKANYLFQVTRSLLHLKHQRFLLDEDVSRLLMEAAQQTYWPAAPDAAQVKIKKITAQPAVVKAGDTIRLAVEFAGLKDRVLTVKASFREANNMNYILNDQGNHGDEKAGVVDIESLAAGKGGFKTGPGLPYFDLPGTVVPTEQEIGGPEINTLCRRMGPPHRTKISQFPVQVRNQGHILCLTLFICRQESHFIYSTDINCAVKMQSQ